MKKLRDIFTSIAAWTILIGGILLIIAIIGFIVGIPKLIATDWDWRCLFVECRIQKE